MDKNQNRKSRIKTFTGIVTGLLLLLCTCNVKSQTNTAGDAAKAWQDVQRAASPLPGPIEWNGNREPNPDEYARYFKQIFNASTAAAKKARAFYTQFPDSTNVIAARILECRMLQQALDVSDGSLTAYEAWLNADNALLATPGLTEDERFRGRMNIALETADDPRIKNPQEQEGAYVNALRQVIKDYPQKNEPYEMLLMLASSSSEDKARAIATEVLADPASDSIKEEAKLLLKRLNAVGKPLNIKFTALDGREVDLSQMKGKVVLIDFWATWCGPCVAEIPHVKEAYDKFHSKGFEVVGISFDSDQHSLQSFVEKNDLPWPQYFDGKEWLNILGVQYAIHSIPTMWLVDKKGNLRDLDANNGLQSNVEKLLAE